MKKVILYILVAYFFMPFPVYPWEGITHSQITRQVEEQNSILNDYLKSIGFSNGRGTGFSLLGDKSTWPQEFRERTETYCIIAGTMCISGTNRTALNWLVEASAEEDNPIIRASNHFHDPTLDCGVSTRHRS